MELIDVTFDEILKAIGELNASNPEGFTCREMSNATGRNHDWCRKHIYELIRADKLKFNGRRKVKRIDEGYAQVPVYTLVDHPNKKKKR